MKEITLVALPGKIEVGSRGLGTVTREMVVDRATQIATTDGREGFNESDLAQAYEELLGVADPSVPPESGAELEGLTEWDEPLSLTGQRAPKTGPAGERNMGELLVQEGLEEAEHEQRLAAAKAHPPEAE